jgi:hypothetical protein
MSIDYLLKETTDNGRSGGLLKLITAGAILRKYTVTDTAALQLTKARFNLTVRKVSHI